MVSSLDLQMALATIPQGFVDELDAAFARIWFLAGCGKTLWARRNFIGLHVYPGLFMNACMMISPFWIARIILFIV